VITIERKDRQKEFLNIWNSASDGIKQQEIILLRCYVEITWKKVETIYHKL
jgi:hypothetical protein